MDLAVRRTPATLTHRLVRETGGPVHVDVINDAGDTVVAARAAQIVGDEPTSERWTVELGADELADVDRLTVEWHVDDDWIETSQVDVLGAPYLLVSQLAAQPGMSAVDPTTLAGAIAETVDRAETYCRQAFVPRLETTVTSGTGYHFLWLKPNLRTIRRAIIDGTEVDTSAWTPDPDGRVDAGRIIAAGARLEVTYTHGWDQPPSDLRDALLTAAVQVTHDRLNTHRPSRPEFAEGTTWVIATADPERGRPFGIPSVDAVLRLRRFEEPVR